MLNILDWRVLNSLSLLFVNTLLQIIGPSVHTKLDSIVFLTRKAFLPFTKNKSLLAKHMYRKHYGLLPKPNHEGNLCDYICSKKDMHMHKEHAGAASV